MSEDTIQPVRVLDDFPDLPGLFIEFEFRPEELIFEDPKPHLAGARFKNFKDFICREKYFCFFRKQRPVVDLPNVILNGDFNGYQRFAERFGYVSFHGGGDEEGPTEYQTLLIMAYVRKIHAPIDFALREVPSIEVCLIHKSRESGQLPTFLIAPMLVKNMIEAVICI